MNLIEMKEKLIEKAVEMSNEPDKYNDYEKGWVTGQISLLKKLGA